MCWPTFCVRVEGVKSSTIMAHPRRRSVQIGGNMESVHMCWYDYVQPYFGRKELYIVT